MGPGNQRLLTVAQALNHQKVVASDAVRKAQSPRLSKAQWTKYGRASTPRNGRTRRIRTLMERADELISGFRGIAGSTDATSLDPSESGTDDCSASCSFSSPSRRCTVRMSCLNTFGSDRRQEHHRQMPQKRSTGVRRQCDERNRRAQRSDMIDVITDAPVSRSRN